MEVLNEGIAGFQIDLLVKVQPNFWGQEMGF